MKVFIQKTKVGSKNINNLRTKSVSKNSFLLKGNKEIKLFIECRYAPKKAVTLTLGGPEQE